MKVLLLEDNPERIDRFRYELTGHDVDQTADVGQAIAWLRLWRYVAIFLDHDLAEHHYSHLDDPTPFEHETGLAAARWIAAHPDASPDAQIVVHSLNPAGGAKMVREMQASGRHADLIPYHYLQWSL